MESSPRTARETLELAYIRDGERCGKTYKVDDNNGVD